MSIRDEEDPGLIDNTPTDKSGSFFVDTPIDKSCISIEINGRTNNSDNPRCTNHNNTLDGFVYNYLAEYDAKNNNYVYKYSNKPPKIDDPILTVDGTYDNLDTSIQPARIPSTTVGSLVTNVSESVINALGDGSYYTNNGLPSNSEGHFIYNEGNSTTVNNLSEIAGGNASGSQTTAAKEGTFSFVQDEISRSNQEKYPIGQTLTKITFTSPVFTALRNGGANPYKSPNN